jgi:hypothetical protein
LKLTNLRLQPSPIRLVEPNEKVTLELGAEEPLPQFTLVAYTGGKAQPQDFPCPVVIDLSGLDIPSQKIPVRYEHKSFQGVGHTEKILIAGGEVIAEGVISRGTSWARDVAQSAKNGFPWQASMGGPIHQAEYVPFGQKVTVNGANFEGELYVIRKMTLKEISFVDLAADEHTSAVIEAQYEEGLEAGGMRLEANAPETNMDTNTKIDMTRYENKNLQPPVSSLLPLVIDQRRIAAIEKIGGGKFPDLEAKAIEEGWSVEKFHAQYQHKTMPSGAAVSVTSPGTANHGGLVPSTLEAIALASSGTSLSFLEAQYDEKTLEMADKYRGIGIQEFCELICAGQHLPKFRRDSRGWLEAAFSSVSLPGILSNIANKVLLEGFTQMDDTWRKVVKIASVHNFQRHERYRMNGLFKYEKVGKDGELKHGQLDEQQFSQKIDTHGIMFSLTRQMIIDDDLGAFTDIPRAIGVGAAEAINDAVWQCLLSNPLQGDGKNFFSAEHKNLFTGDEYKLDIGGLTHAELKFSEQERAPGRPLGIPATILLVPTALKVAAEMLMKSLMLNETTAQNKPQPVTNPHAGKYEVIATPYLASKAFANASALAWYLLASPLRLAALEVGFLGGVDHPTVERADADFNTLGMLFRGYIDFGVKEQDWRGIIKLVP